MRWRRINETSSVVDNGFEEKEKHKQNLISFQFKILRIIFGLLPWVNKE
jgi:hypothetical protein